MRKVIVTTILSAFMFSQVAVTAQAEVSSLRGMHNLDLPAKAIQKKKQMTAKGGFARSWKLQPPGIPHDIAKDRISLSENTCMTCHAKENHKEKKAPEIAESHYVNRDGKVLSKPSSRRHFCMQCHAPQLDATPLVENTF